MSCEDDTINENNYIDKLNEKYNGVVKLDKKLFEGVIATADQFIANPEKKEWIQETFNADALEMEGASVAVVCDSLDIPFLVLRAISDTANNDAEFDFDEFLQKSSKNSADFMISVVDKLL